LNVDDLHGRDREARSQAASHSAAAHRGYHDEPLKGARAGQRSIRLSRAYRAIYEVKGGTAKFVSIEEVSKHDY
jgi:proteic killer suppression protein